MFIYILKQTFGKVTLAEENILWENIQILYYNSEGYTLQT